MVTGFTGFERAFPSLCFALATGVGKTRLCACVYQARGIRNFFILAPNFTIYNKLTQDLNPRHPEVRLPGPTLWHSRPASRRATSIGSAAASSTTRASRSTSSTQRRHAGRAGTTTNFKEMNEYLGQSCFDHLWAKEDLMILMDESHRYRGDAWVRVMRSCSPCSAWS